MAIGIHCCKDCVPPERHPGCHAKCEKYLKAKAKYEEDKKKARANQVPKITMFDFDKICYASCKRNKNNKRRR